MAKRLTDTDKWKDDWYLGLSNDDKIVWQWLIDNCSHAGVCKRSLGLLNMMCRVNYTEEILLQKMDGRVINVNNLWFIPKFIKFQYPTLLSAKPAILSVVKELFSINCVKLVGELFGNDYKIIEESFNNHYEMIKVKDRVKDKDKDKYKDRKSIKGGAGGKREPGGFFSKEQTVVVFADGSEQELTAEQIELVKKGELKPWDIYKQN